MRRATLIFNPRAGKGRDFEATVREVVEALARQGVEASAVATTGPGTAGDLAAASAAAGVDIVFACGGDGTVHEVLQGLAGTETALGVIPIGTANALARDLGIARDPMSAAAQQANAEAVRIPVGRICYQANLNPTVKADRYFTVMAGAGPDGALVYSLLTGQKSAMGRTAYYVQAARLFLTRSFSAFQVAYRVTGSDGWERDTAVSVISARIGSLGGAFGRLTPGCSLGSPSLRLFLVRPPGRIGLISWFVFGRLGVSRLNPWLRTLDVEEFRCESLHEKGSVYAQVDGEWIGGLPIAVSVAPESLLLLMPSRQRSKIGPPR